MIQTYDFTQETLIRLSILLRLHSEIKLWVVDTLTDTKLPMTYTPFEGKQQLVYTISARWYQWLDSHDTLRTLGTNNEYVEVHVKLPENKIVKRNWNKCFQQRKAYGIDLRQRFYKTETHECKTFCKNIRTKIITIQLQH